MTTVVENTRDAIARIKATIGITAIKRLTDAPENAHLPDGSGNCTLLL
jgi:hypothetical protein